MDRPRWILLLMLFLIVSVGMLYAQKPVGQNRPPAVPSDYVITPFGYFHPSCVRQVKEGETLLGDGRIQFADGSAEASAQACGFPRFTPAGALVADGATSSSPLEISWSWIEAGQVATDSTYGGVAANWTVPPTPYSNDDQTLFFFPSLSHHDSAPPSEEPIIQPVLGWNDGQAGAGPWNIASWNCCPSGMTWSSTPVTVSPGDQLSGTVITDCGSVMIGTCARWKITTKDLTTSQSTILRIIYPSLMKFPWAQSGVLEVYNINQCSDYPPDGSIIFSNVALYDNHLRRIAQPGWSPLILVAQGSTPWCNYGVTVTDTTATLTY